MVKNLLPIYFNSMPFLLHPVIVFDWPISANKRMLIVSNAKKQSSGAAVRPPFAAIGHQMHVAREIAQTRVGTGMTKRKKPMPEQAPRPAATQTAGAKLVNLYKPVGIAALNAAALCKNSGTLNKKSK